MPAGKKGTRQVVVISVVHPEDYCLKDEVLKKCLPNFKTLFQAFCYCTSQWHWRETIFFIVYLCCL